MCMQKCTVLTPNQRQTCVASRCKSSFTWNISVRAHSVTTEPSPHTPLTLPPSSSSSLLILSPFPLFSAHLIFIAYPTWDWRRPFCGENGSLPSEPYERSDWNVCHGAEEPSDKMGQKSFGSISLVWAKNAFIFLVKQLPSAFFSWCLCRGRDWLYCMTILKVQTLNDVQVLSKWDVHEVWVMIFICSVLALFSPALGISHACMPLCPRVKCPPVYVAAIREA